MTPVWAFVVFTVVLSAAVLVLAARRAHDEMSPTIEAFDRFRAAISPTAATLAGETEATRRRIALANDELERRGAPDA